MKSAPIRSTAFRRDKHSLAGGGEASANDKGGKVKLTLFDKIARFIGQLVVFTFVLTMLIAVVAAAIAIAYERGADSNDRFFRNADAPRLLPYTNIKTAENVFEDWVANVKKAHVIARKIGAISLADSLIGDPSEHVFLGVFERDVLRRKTEAALHFYLAASNGHPDAYRLYKDLNVPSEDYEALYQRFVVLHQMNGDLGLLRLGQYHLGKNVFEIADNMKTDLRFTEPNDYIWPRQDDAEGLAYMHFQMAFLCGSDAAQEWRAEVARFYQFTEERERTLRQRANSELRSLARRYKTGRRANQDEYCQRGHLDGLFEGLQATYLSQVTVDYEERFDDGYDDEEHPCDDPGHDYTDEECDEFDEYVVDGGFFEPSVTIPSFQELIDQVQSGDFAGGGGGGDSGGRDSDRRRSSRTTPSDPSSPAFRSNPGGQATDNMDVFPSESCDVAGGRGDCDNRADRLACYGEAESEYYRGVADMAEGRTTNARRRFESAIEIGRACQSEHAELAGKRLAALNLTCEYNEGSLRAISRDFQLNESGGAIIDLPSRQRALRAKGYYDGNIDGKYGPATRQAVRQFQREFGFSETGDLTPIETVYLICSAAETHADLKSINTLGIMHIAGLGVIQNTDRGIRELTRAADRGNTDSMFNLSLIYGTGTVLSSYRLCGNVENLQRADSWLQLAAAAGHGPARRLVEMFGSYGPTERWERIEAELQLNDFYNDRLRDVGEACRPN